MGLLSKVKSKASALVQDKIVRYDNESRRLEINGVALSYAARFAARQIDPAKAVNTKIHPDRFEVCLELKTGMIVSVTVVPVEIRIEGNSATIRCSVPGGLKIGHENMLKSLLAGFVEVVFSVGRNRISSMPGVSFENEMFSYSRNLEDLSILSALMSKTEGKRQYVVPMSIHDGWLSMDLSGLSNHGGLPSRSDLAGTWAKSLLGLLSESEND